MAMLSNPNNFDGVSLHKLDNVFDDHRTVGVGIKCKGGPVGLQIPRRIWPNTDGPNETKREVLEALKSQVDNLLAVEALEGR